MHQSKGESIVCFSWKQIAEPLTMPLKLMIHYDMVSEEDAAAVADVISIMATQLRKLTGASVPPVTWTAKFRASGNFSGHVTGTLCH